RLFQSNQNRIIVSCAVEMAVLPSPSIGVRCLRLALSLPADAGEMLCGAAPGAYLPVAVDAAAIHCTTKHSSYCRGIYPRPARAFPLFPNSKKSLTL
ncbi:hypothetical protein, partial [Enterobacter hormaechei]